MTNYFINRKSETTGTVTMAFDLASPPKTRQALTTLQFTKTFADKLCELQQLFIERKSNLRVENLRGRLQLADQQLLRLNLDGRRLGFTALVTPTAPKAVESLLNLAVESWLNEQVADGLSQDGKEHQVFNDLKALASRGAFSAQTRPMDAFNWIATQRQTVQPGDKGSFPDLADYVALALEGKTLWASQKPMRLLTSQQSQASQASLISEPLANGDFSYVVTIQILTFALFPQPMVNIKITKRNWIGRNAKTKNFVRNNSLTAYAYPKDSSRVLSFELHRREVKPDTWEFETGDDYAAIARAYDLPLRLTLPELLKIGTSHEACHLLVNVKHGVTQKESSKKVGVTNDDKLEAIRMMCPHLEKAGLKLNQSFVPVATETRDRTKAQEHQLQWSLESDPALRKLWKEDTFSHIQQLYGSQYELLLAYQSEHQQDALWLKDHIQRLFTSEDGQQHLRIHTVKLPPLVHGPREAGKPKERVERQNLRWNEWLEGLELANLPGIDGIMVLAQQWYGNRPDDKFNKMLTRHRLTTHFEKPVQFVRPRIDLESASDKDFERNFMMGWMDLAYQSKGRVTPWTLADAAVQIFDRRSAQPTLFTELQYPDEVMALGVISKNKSRFGNTKGSVFPYAIRLNIATGVCQARIAHVKPVTGLDVWQWMPMEEALTYISSLGEIRIHQAQRGLRPMEVQKKQSENIQQFFNVCLTEFNAVCDRPLVFVDADTSKAYWNWLTDARIDPNNVNLVNPNAQGNWSKVRLVRVRTDNSPKILIGRRHTADEVKLIDGELELTGEKNHAEGTNAAETQLYQLADTPTFISFGRRKIQRPVIGSNIHAKYRFKSTSTQFPLQGSGKLKTVYQYVQTPASKDQWATPSGVEFMVARPAGEDPVRLATLGEWLRQNYAHINEWTEQPAPMSFARKLKQYVFDLNYVEKDEDEADD